MESGKRPRPAWLDRPIGLGLIGSIILALSAVTFPGVFFIPQPADGSDFAWAVFFLPIILLAAGLACVEFLWLVVYLVKHRLRRVALGLPVVALIALALFVAYLWQRFFSGI